MCTLHIVYAVNKISWNMLWCNIIACVEDTWNRENWRFWVREDTFRYWQVKGQQVLKIHDMRESLSRRAVWLRGKAFRFWRCLKDSKSNDSLSYPHFASTPREGRSQTLCRCTSTADTKRVDVDLTTCIRQELHSSTIDRYCTSVCLTLQKSLKWLQRGRGRDGRRLD